MALIGHVTNDGYFESLKQDIQHLGLENDVTIIPGIPPGSQALVDAYHAADIFFYPRFMNPLASLSLRPGQLAFQSLPAGLVAFPLLLKMI